MSVLFGRKGFGPTKINEVQINQSVLGFPVPVVMGRAKIQQSLLWVGGFTSKQITTGGKGFGGGKDGNQYVYSADVLAALCDGGDNGIAGIGDVWSGQSWLPNVYGLESFVIGSASYYTPTNSSALTANIGVSRQVPYSGVFNDLAGTQTLTGTHTVPLAQVPWGTRPIDRPLLLQHE
jgi:hypothetical protein